MQNLEQIRAASAWQTGRDETAGGKQNGEVIKKIPPMIQNHGFLAAAAYAYDDGNRGWRVAFDAIARHLADTRIGILPREKDDTAKMIEFLTIGEGATSLNLKNATAEALAWLGYARRFIKKGDNHS